MGVAEGKNYGRKDQSRHRRQHTENLNIDMHYFAESVKVTECTTVSLLS